MLKSPLSGPSLSRAEPCQSPNAEPSCLQLLRQLVQAAERLAVPCWPPVILLEDRTLFSARWPSPRLQARAWCKTLAPADACLLTCPITRTQAGAAASSAELLPRLTDTIKTAASTELTFEVWRTKSCAATSHRAPFCDEQASHRCKLPRSSWGHRTSPAQSPSLRKANSGKDACVIQTACLGPSVDGACCAVCRQIWFKVLPRSTTDTQQVLRSWLQLIESDLEPTPSYEVHYKFLCGPDDTSKQSS